jgi:hypothetical protein
LKTRIKAVLGQIVRVIQVLDNAFYVDKVEASGLKFLGSDCGQSAVRRGGY